MINNSPEKYVERLHEVTNNKLKLLQDVLLLTKEQSESITEEGLTALGNIIDKKQSRIDDINKLDDEFNVYFHRLKSELKVKNLDELKNSGMKGVNELKESIKSVMGLLNEIFEIEKRNSDEAKILLSGLGSELKKLNMGKKINSVYKPAPNDSASYYIDKKK